MTGEGPPATPIEIYGTSTHMYINNTHSESTCDYPLPATIDFSSGSVNGTDCAQLDAFSDAEVSKIEFINGNRASGRYVAVVNANGTAVTDNNFYETTRHSPYAVDAVYSAAVNATYVGPDITYSTGIRVTPTVFAGGPDGSDTDEAGSGAVGDGDTSSSGETPGGRYGVFSSVRSLVFVNAVTGNLSTIDPKTHVVTDYGITGVQATGPNKADLTGDNVADTPYVNESNTVLIANASGSTPIASGAASQKARLAIGSWNGSQTSVFYADRDNKIHRVRPNGQNVVVADTTDHSGVEAIAGIGDVDGDGRAELVYVDTSETLHYVDQDGSLHLLHGGNMSLGSSSAGIGVGSPALFNGTVYVPVVDTSGNIHLLNDDTKIDISSASSDKSPITSVDLDGDGNLELVYLSGGTMKYADDVLGSPTTGTVYDSANTAIEGDKQTGVA